MSALRVVVRSLLVLAVIGLAWQVWRLDRRLRPRGPGAWRAAGALVLVLLAGCGNGRRVASGPTPVPEDTAYVLLNPRTVPPTPLHVAIRQMVGECAGPERIRTPLLLALADSIIGVPSGQLAYGIAGQLDSLAILVVQASHVNNAAVVSHELLHAVWLATETDPLIRHCTLYVGVDLPIRTVADPWWYVERGQVIQVRRRP